MKIGILSRNRHIYSTSRLVDEAHERGLEVALIDVLKTAVTLGYRPRIPRRIRRANRSWWHGLIPQVDGIIPRIGASSTSQGLLAVRFFEAQGIPTTATADAIRGSRDKFRSIQLMRAAELPIPTTVLVSAAAEVTGAAEAVGGFPLVMKLNQSTHGRGVLMVPNRATALAVLEVLAPRGISVLFQAFVREAVGRDVRLIIIGERCVAAMERTARPGEFRSNLHLGGTAEAITPAPELVELARRGAGAHGLAVGGVDIIHSANGPLILEVNSSPGLEGIEGATGINIAGQIVDHLVAQIPARRPSPAARQPS